MGSCLAGLHLYQEAIEEYKKGNFFRSPRSLALPLVDNVSVIQELIKGVLLSRCDKS